MLKKRRCKCLDCRLPAITSITERSHSKEEPNNPTLDTFFVLSSHLDVMEKGKVILSARGVTRMSN
jgi:hypothetical protein